MSRITSYDPTANQLFAQGAAQGAGYVNAAADNQRAAEALALRQQAMQFEMQQAREQDRQRLMREARTRGANERIFKLLKEKTPSGDLAMMSQYVGLGPTLGLPSVEQAASMQLQGMAGQPDVFDRLLVESPDVLQDASPALVELVRDRGGQAAAQRIQKINATANTLAERGLAKYAKQYISEAERLGLDPQEKMRPTKQALAIQEQERADKENMLVDRGYQPGTPDWDKEMQRSYKMSLMLWEANDRAKREKAKADLAAAEQAQRAGLVTAMQSAGPLSPEQQLAIQGDPSLRRIFDQTNAPTITPEQQAAQDEAEAADLIALGMPPEKAIPYVRAKRAGNMTASQAPMGGGGPDQTVFLRKQVDDRKAEYEFALERAKMVGLVTRDGVTPAAEVPNDPSDPKRQAYANLLQAERGLERAMANLRNAGQGGVTAGQSSTGAAAPVLVPPEQVPQVNQSLDQLRDALTQQLGRMPTHEEMKAALSRQSQMPQLQR